jgi:hypothetical protein
MAIAQVAKIGLQNRTPLRGGVKEQKVKAQRVTRKHQE